MCAAHLQYNNKSTDACIKEKTTFPSWLFAVVSSGKQAVRC